MRAAPMGAPGASFSAAISRSTRSTAPARPNTSMRARRFSLVSARLASSAASRTSASFDQSGFSSAIQRRSSAACCVLTARDGDAGANVPRLRFHVALALAPELVHDARRDRRGALVLAAALERERCAGERVGVPARKEVLGGRRVRSALELGVRSQAPDTCLEQRKLRLESPRELGGAAEVAELERCACPRERELGTFGELGAERIERLRRLRVATGTERFDPWLGIEVPGGKPASRRHASAGGRRGSASDGGRGWASARSQPELRSPKAHKNAALGLTPQV